MSSRTGITKDLQVGITANKIFTTFKLSTESRCLKSKLSSLIATQNLRFWFSLLLYKSAVEQVCISDPKSLFWFAADLATPLKCNVRLTGSWELMCHLFTCFNPTKKNAEPPLHFCVRCREVAPCCPININFMCSVAILPANCDRELELNHLPLATHLWTLLKFFFILVWLPWLVLPLLPKFSSLAELMICFSRQL